MDSLNRYGKIAIRSGSLPDRNSNGELRSTAGGIVPAIGSIGYTESPYRMGTAFPGTGVLWTVYQTRIA